MKKRQKTTKVRRISNWKKIVAIYIIVTFLVGLLVGVGYYQITTTKYENSIQENAITELNDQLREITDFTIKYLDENWEPQSLNTDVNIVKFGQEIEECIKYKNYNDSLDYKIDYDNQESFFVTIYAKETMENDSFSVSPKIVLEYSFNYELIGKEQVCPTAEEYRTIAESTILSNSVAFGLVSYTVIICLTLVYVICKNIIMLYIQKKLKS